MGHADPRYWERTDEGIFILKAGAIPSEALKAFINGFTIADCGQVIVVAQYFALMQILGEEKFNAMFNSNCVPLVINRLVFDRIQRFQIPPSMFFYGKPNVDPNGIGKRPISKGSFCYIANHPDYPLKHPAGIAQGFNVICAGKNEDKKAEELYLTFLQPQTLTEVQLCKVLQNSYNQPRTAFDAKEQKQENLVKKYPDQIDENSVRGFVAGTVIVTNYKVISDFARVSTSQAVQMMKSIRMENSYVYPIDNLNDLNKYLLKYPDDLRARLIRASFNIDQANLTDALNDCKYVMEHCPANSYEANAAIYYMSEIKDIQPQHKLYHEYSGTKLHSGPISLWSHAPQGLRTVDQCELRPNNVNHKM